MMPGVVSEPTSRSSDFDRLAAAQATDPRRSSHVRPPASGTTDDVLDPTLASDEHGPARGVAGQPRGSVIGRYIVLEMLGAGGMGVVYAAYDPELDRKVAIKCILPTPSRDENRSNGRVRLVREAQAMARISHPNVIHVHDVGTAGEAVFVAMELVDGWTLKRWLEQHEPSLHETLAVFMQAGRGLAAAHAVDLVHRDFKPDNVLVGRDGQVRVVDFGLARLGRSASEDEAFARDSASSLDLHLTATGSIMGTPAYMAPEQHARSLADARSDQFAFCVALYEAVYGERPFAGQRAIEVATAVIGGEIRPPPAGARVPSWLRRVLLRGLAASPEDRYPSMEALLRALSRDAIRRRRRWLTGIGGLALVGVLAVSAFSAGRHRSRVDCDPDETIAALWNPARRAALADTFVGSGAADGQAAWERVEPRIERWLARWRRAYVDACEATHVHATQSLDTLELRYGCLSHALQYLDASLDLFAAADSRIVEQTARTLEQIPAPQSCVGPALTSVTLPSDPVARAAIEDIEASLIRAKTLESGRKMEAALAVAEEALALAEETGHPSTIASALLVVADIRVESEPLDEDMMVRSFSLALSARDDRLAAKVAASMSSKLMLGMSRSQEGLRWAEVAEALIDRAGGLPDAQRVVDNARGVALSRLGRTADAREVFEGMLAEARAEAEPTTGLLQVLLNLGALHGNAGAMDVARPYLEEALEVGTLLHGPDDHRLSRILGNLANIAIVDGRHEDAEHLLERALAIERASERSVTLAEALGTLGLLRRRQGKPAEAAVHYREALEVYEAIVGLHHHKAIETTRNMAVAIFHDGRRDEALEAIEHVLSVADPSATPPGELVLLHKTAAELAGSSDPEKMRAYAEEALRLAEEGDDPRAAVRIDPLRLLGTAQRLLGRPVESLATLQRAVLTCDELQTKGMPRAQLEWQLVLTHEAVGEKDEARRIAKRVLREHLSEPRGLDAAKVAAEIEAWLAASGREDG
jgi:eukaryotic-like serine/threonine-protein kinase